MRLKVHYVLWRRKPQTAAVGGSKEKKGQTDGNSAGVSQQTKKYTATYHAGGGEGGNSLFVWELFLGHIGYISLKTKNIFHFFIIIFLAKT